MAKEKKVKKEAKKGDYNAEKATEVEPAETLRYVVSMKPGSAASQPVRFRVEEGQLEGTVLGIIEHGLNRTYQRATKEVVDSIKREMTKEYGINANGQAVKTEQKAKGLFTRQEQGGIKYMGLDLIIASKQTGGYSRYA